MLLDPSDLRARYTRMEEWKGVEWVNFYTETVPEEFAKRHKRTPSPSRSPTPSGRMPFPEAHPSHTAEEQRKEDLPPVSVIPPTESTFNLEPGDPSGPSFPEPEPAPFTPLIPELPKNQPGHKSQASSISTVSSQPASGDAKSSMFPLPHPPLDADQQKKHDKAVKKIVKDDAKVVKEAEKALKKEAKLAAKQKKDSGPEPPRHFIILPWDITPSKRRWERVPVAGAASEVDAHCGIFFRYGATIDERS